ncbi:CpsD/CapB family tyrosine-protein kinase [Brevibacillus sp. 179-C9.3 HS]|uniref:CpsD/CapB family tyrosine-protein kinase n=1 Tax=unclassified Brevibacillus TaxID=2684853 RepID=UPI00399EFB76
MKNKKPFSKLVCYSNPKSPIAEAYRTLRTNIRFSTPDLRTMIITSAQPGEGKTTTISNLAIAFAQAGVNVLLIDGDMRKPTLHHVFRLQNELGLSSLLNGQAELNEVIQPINVNRMDVITAGPIPEAPTELLSSERMRKFMYDVKFRYELILIDSPPLLPVADSQVLSSLVDGVLLVLRSGKVKVENAKKAKMLLDHVGARIIGAVLNDMKMSKSTSAYYEYAAVGKGVDE